MGAGVGQDWPTARVRARHVDPCALCVPVLLSTRLGLTMVDLSRGGDRPRDRPRTDSRGQRQHVRRAVPRSAAIHRKLDLVSDVQCVVAGAPAAMVSAWLVETTGSSRAVSMYVLIGCLVSLVAVAMLRETQNRP